MPLDPATLSDNTEVLQKVVVDLSAQLDQERKERLKLETLIRDLLDARRNRKSERLSPGQLELFEKLFQERGGDLDSLIEPVGEDDPDPKLSDGNDTPTGDAQTENKKRAARRPLPRNLKRERIVHDLPSQDKHCSQCDCDLRPVGEDTSERYEYVPASLKVVEDVCLKYAVSV